MLVLLALVILAVWGLVATATVALCVYAKRADDEMEGGELAPVIELFSSAA
jgi:K+ transporter